MATLLDLVRRLEKLDKKAMEKANERSKVVAVAILRDLIFNTPVDVSTAMSNWQVGLDAPVSSRIAAYVPGKKGSTRGPSSSAAFSIGHAKIMEKLPGEPLYISNLTPYIKELDNGSSKQAPAGFVDRAILIGRSVGR